MKPYKFRVIEREERDVRVAWVSAQKGRFQEDAAQLYITFQKASELKNNSHLFFYIIIRFFFTLFCASRLFISPRPDFIWRFGLEPGGEDSPSFQNAFISKPSAVTPLLLPSLILGDRPRRGWGQTLSLAHGSLCVVRGWMVRGTRVWVWVGDSVHERICM